MIQQDTAGKSGRTRKVVHVVLKVLLSLLLVMPILGATGMFPEPTPEMYNTEAAFLFIDALMGNGSYIQYLMAIVFAVSVFMLWTGREAFAALLIAPVTVNIVGFHLFLDGGLLMGGAVMGNILLALNVYLLWQNKERYRALLQRHRG